jgi:hypothetical protein
MPERTDLPPVLETFGADLRAAMHEAEARDAGRRDLRTRRVAQLVRATLRSPKGAALSRFMDRPRRELACEYGADLAQITRPASKRQRARPRVLAGTTAGLAAVGTVLALALGATTSSPAFAVARNGDGTVTLTIKQLAGITGANAKLAALGVRARAVPVVAGCAASPVVTGLVARTDGARVPLPSSHAPRVALVSVRIDPSKIPAGQTLVLAAKQDSHAYVTLLAQEMVRGPAPACLGAPPPPPIPIPIRGSCRAVHSAALPRPVRRPPSGFDAVQLNAGKSANSGAGNTGPGNGGTSKGGAGNSPIGKVGAPAIGCRVPPPGNRNGGNSGEGGSTRK